ncbi:MAG: fluoride efflux transporter CrcB [Gemmataceae bacterium]|nr:fluoride efflux transporter CrcB [Gemmataceae bacterium]
MLAFLLHPATLLTLGGGAGANARYWLGAWMHRAGADGAFPWATFAVNVSGSVVLGVVAALFRNHPEAWRKSWYLLLGTGFCGGFTTFSTFSLETLELVRAGRPWMAAVYVCGSVAAGLAGVWLATALADGRG